MDTAIRRAIETCGGEESDWRMVGKAAVHVSVKETGAANMVGPAVIEGGTIWGGDIWGGEWHRSPVLVQGTRYAVSEGCDSHIVSGCIRKPVGWWLDNVRRCAEENEYTPAQVDEYEAIIDFIASGMETLGDVPSEKPEEAIA